MISVTFIKLHILNSWDLEQLVFDLNFVIFLIHFVSIFFFMVVVFLYFWNSKWYHEQSIFFAKWNKGRINTFDLSKFFGFFSNTRYKLIAFIKHDRIKKIPLKQFVHLKYCNSFNYLTFKMLFYDLFNNSNIIKDKVY